MSIESQHVPLAQANIQHQLASRQIMTKRTKQTTQHNKQGSQYTFKTPRTLKICCLRMGTHRALVNVKARWKTHETNCKQLKYFHDFK